MVDYVDEWLEDDWCDVGDEVCNFYIDLDGNRRVTLFHICDDGELEELFDLVI